MTYFWVNIDKIKELAKSKGISVSFLCKKVGMKRTYLHDVSNGGYNIPEERLQIIAEALGTTTAYLRDETEYILPPSEDGILSTRREIIQKFELLTENEQEQILNLMELLLNKSSQEPGKNK